MKSVSSLPTGWARATIPEVISNEGLFSDGDWIETEDQDPAGDVRLIQLADIGDGPFLNKSKRFLTQDKAAALRCTFLNAGDVLIARMPDPLGRACIFPGDSKRAVTAVDVCIARSGDDCIDHRWLKNFINAPQFKIAVAALQSGSTRKRISRKNLATIGLPVPPSNEQLRIVDKTEELLSDLDAAVGALKRARANLKRYRAAVLKAAVEGKLTAEWREANPPSEPADKLLERILFERRKKWEEGQLQKYAAQCKEPQKGWKESYDAPPLIELDFRTLPEGWCWASVAQTSNVQGGIQKQPKRTPQSNAYPYLRVANVHRNKLDLSEIEYFELFGGELERLRLEAGDILIVEGNGSKSEIGRSAIWQGEIDNCVHQNHLIRVRFEAGFPEYLNAYWNSPVGNQNVMDKAASTSGLYTLSTKKVSAMPLPLPPIDEQRQIVKEVEARLSVIAHADAEIGTGLRRAARLRQAILKRAFEGKLVPQDPNDEPASVLLERIRATRAEDAMAGKRPAAQRRGREIAAKGGPRMLTKAERDFLRRDKAEVMQMLRARRKAT